MTTINDASAAYINALKQASGGSAVKSAEAPAGASFGDVLKEAAQTAINAQHKSEKISAAAVVGKASMTDVLQAVNDAEIALNTVLAVRDRVVQAYEQILRTPI